LLTKLSMIFYDNFFGLNVLLLLLRREWMPELNMGS